MKTRSKYQEEPVELRDPIWDQGLIDPWQLLRIGAWKSAKGLASMSLNDEAKIRTTTAKACEILRPMRDLDVLVGETNWSLWEQGVHGAIGSKPNRTGLLGLHGIGYRMATAILCVLNPRAFPVLDQWAVRGLYGSDARSMGFYCRAVRYCQYAQDLAARRAEIENAHSIHDVDQYFMQDAMDSSGVARDDETLG